MTWNRRAIVAGAAALALALTSTGPAFGRGDTAAGPAGGAGGRRPVTVGLIEQTAGGFVTPEFGTAVEAVVDYVNAERRGVGGHPLELDVCHTDGTPTSAVACAERFAADDDVHLVIESTTTPSAIADVLVPAGKALMAGGVDLGTMFRPGVFVFDPGTAGIAHSLFGYAATNADVSNITVFHADDPAIAEAAPFIRGVAGHAGLGVDAFVPLGFDGDLAGPIAAGLDEGSDGAMFIVAPSQCGPVAQALQDLDLDVPVLVAELCLTDDLVAGGTTEGWYAGTQSVTSVANGGAEGREARRILRRYGDGAETGGLAGLGVGYAWVAQDVLRIAGAGRATDASVLRALGRYASPDVLGLDRVACPGPAPFIAACNASTLIVRVRNGQVRDVGGFVRTDFRIFADLLGGP